MMYNFCKEGIQTAKSDNQDQLAEASILVTAILNFVRVLIEVNQRAARIKGGRKARTIPQRDHDQKGQKLSKRKIMKYVSFCLNVIIAILSVWTICCVTKMLRTKQED